MIIDLSKNKKLIIGIITLALLIFSVYASLPFLSAFFGAAILAYIFNPLNKRLRKRFSPRSSAVIILLISLIIVILPVIFIVNGLINQVYLLPEQIDVIRNLKDGLNEVVPFDIDLNLNQVTDQMVAILTRSLTPVFTNIINAMVILFLLFFVLYYLVFYSEDIREIVSDYMPFSSKINNRIIEKFQQVTSATIIGTFFIAIVQGGLLAINFYMLGIPNAIFWGFVTAILSFLPIVGAPIVWIPASLILLSGGEISKGVVLIIVGMFISTIDNILRPIINQRYGSIHPLTSIVGIYIGISQFGVMGVFIGPLIVVYLLLFWDLYRGNEFG
ncbi:hypothetical protein CMI42_04525 [Candidatus Pacearchaeota archaeon]|nr:hypothetical protein [Candidatus Pacearchaeota archaeon]